MRINYRISIKFILFNFINLLVLSSNCQTVKSTIIGSNCWMAENLNVDKFRNGDDITQAKSNEEWKKACENKQPAWCYYANDSQIGEKYGKLYNWYAVIDSRGLAPEGWHVATIEEWGAMRDFLGEPGKYGVGAGNKMRSRKDWSLLSGNNESGFTALPGMCRYYYVVSNQVKIGFGEKKCAQWWCVGNIKNSRTADYCRLGETGDLFFYRENKEWGLSVRCVKN